MRFFHSELLAKYRSRDDDIADAAAKKWDSAAAAYQTRLRVIKSRLPLGIRRFLSNFTLHDARILAATSSKHLSLFTMLMQLEGAAASPGKIIQLFYLTEAKAPPQRAPACDVPILYDEVDWDEQKEEFTHSLLLANASELVIRFQDFDFNSFELPIEQAKKNKTKRAV